MMVAHLKQEAHQVMLIKKGVVKGNNPSEVRFDWLGPRFHQGRRSTGRTVMTCLFVRYYGDILYTNIPK